MYYLFIVITIAHKHRWCRIVQCKCKTGTAFCNPRSGLLLMFVDLQAAFIIAIVITEQVDTGSQVGHLDF